MFTFFHHWSQIVGLRQDFLRVLILFVLNIFFSFFFRFIYGSTLRRLYSWILGVVFLVLMLDEWGIYVIVTGLISYFLLSPLKNNHLIISIVISFPFLLYVHLYRIIYAYQDWSVDCSVMQMMITTKIIYFGLHLRNTSKPYPFSHYLGYVFFFPGVLVGPTLSVETYEQFINLEKQFKKIKYSWSSVLSPLFKGLILSPITVLLIPHYPPEWMLTNQFYLSLVFPLKIVFFTTIGIIHRVKFYSAWYITQAAVNCSGISYQQNGNFDGVSCGSFQFEIEPNPRLKTEYWNASVQKWLRICFYEPLTTSFSKNSSLPMIIVFISSAVWHGVYPAYYIGFIMWAFCVNLAKYFYKASYKFASFEGPLLRFITWFLSLAMLSIVGWTVVLLDLKKVLLFLNQIYWSVPIAVISLTVFFMVTGWGQKKPKVATN